MRRLVVALVVAAVMAAAVALVGCASTPPATPPAATAPPAAPAAPAPSAAAPSSGIKPGSGISNNEPPVFSQFPTGPAVPKEVADRIVAKQPTLIYFYDSSQNTSKENRKVINEVLEDNRGLVDLVAYDLGKHMVGNASAPVAVDSSFPKDAKYQQAVALAQSLGVSFQPFIVLTDGQGYIIWKYRGLVDKDFLQREIMRASN